MWYHLRATSVPGFIFIIGMTFLSYPGATAQKYPVVFVRFTHKPQYGPYDHISLDVVLRGRIVTLTRLARKRCTREVTSTQEILTLEDSRPTADALKDLVHSLWQIEFPQNKRGRWQVWFGEGLRFAKHQVSADFIISSKELWNAYLWLISKAHEHLKINYYTELPPQGNTCTLNVLLPQGLTGILDQWLPLPDGTYSLELPCRVHSITLRGKTYTVRLKRGLVTNFSPDSVQ